MSEGNEDKKLPEKPKKLVFKSSTISTDAFARSKENFVSQPKQTSIQFKKLGIFDVPQGEKRDKSTAPAAEPEQLLFGQKRQRGELTFATLARKNSTDIPEDDSQDAKRVKTIELEFVKKEEGAEMKLQIPVKPKEASEKPQEPIPEVITGEENDTYILKMAGKLWKFQDGAYAERGRVELKINCAKNYYATSRMICRAEVGNKRLLINSVFFPEMKIERKSDKRVQFNACSSEDDNSMRLFLFQCANPTEADELLLKLNEHHGFSKIHAYNMREDEKDGC